MALFKISKGESKNLPQSTTEGYAYFTTDKGEFFVDTATTTNSAMTARTMLSGLAFVNGENGDHAGAWLANYSGLQLHDGLSILYKPSIDSSSEENYTTQYTGALGGIVKVSLSNTCLNLNYSGWKKCFCDDLTLIKNQFKKDIVVLMVYDTSLDNNNGGWYILGSPNDVSTVDGKTVTLELVDNDDTKIPTSGAVSRYIKSLTYDGSYIG